MAARSYPSKGPVCIRRWSIRSALYSLTSSSTSRFRTKVASSCFCCARKHTVTYQPTISQLRADPACAVAHRQERLQIWLLTWHYHPAPWRTQPDPPIVMLDNFHHAACQRAGPGDHRLSHRRFLGFDTFLPVFEGPARDHRLRRRRRHNHAPEVRKLSSELIPRTGKWAVEVRTGNGDDVDSVAVVERLRNMPTPQGRSSRLRWGRQCPTPSLRYRLPQTACQAAA